MTVGEPGAEWGAGRGSRIWTSTGSTPSGSPAGSGPAAGSGAPPTEAAAAAPRESRRERDRRARNATRAEAKADVLEAREQLVSALNRLEDRVNVPKRARLRAEEFARESPGATLAIGLVAAAAVGGIVWLAVRRALRS